MKLLITYLVAILGFCSSGCAEDLKLRALPQDNLSYPLLLELHNGDTGSGFFLSTSNNVYLVTAKHVLFNPTGGLKSSEVDVTYYSASAPQSSVFTVNLSTIGQDNLKPHPSRDVVVIKMFSFEQDGGGKTIRTLPGVAIRQQSQAGVTGAPLENFKKFDQVLVGNDVILFGYPTSLGLQAMPQIDSRHPLLRKGIIAGENLRTRSIVLDCPSYPGNSGGPVVEIDRDFTQTHFNIIGVVSEYVPYADSGRNFMLMTNSGYSIATPIDFVLELVN